MQRAFVPLLLLAALPGCEPASARGGESSSAPIAYGSVESPPIDFELPDFELLDHEKKPFKKSDLLGKVWVVDFVFTSCPVVCPTMTKRMSDLAKELDAEDGVRFLSITVDPENDTPEKLKAFGEQHGHLTPRWRFVTGEPKMVDDTVVKGFLMAVRRGSARADISHAERFVVVDERAHVRGLYDTDPEGLAAIKARVRELIAE